MALKKAIEQTSGVITEYTKIEKVMVNYSGEGSIEITVTEFLNENIRNRMKKGELLGPYSERQYYLPLGNESVNRAVLYARLKKETTELAGAVDVFDSDQQIAEAKI